MGRLLQIHEADLATLEATLPRLMDAQAATMNNADRVKWRGVAEILRSVRWNYGPPCDVTVIPAGEE